MSKNKKPLQADPVEEYLHRMDKQRPHKVDVEKVVNNWKPFPCPTCPRYLQNRKPSQSLAKPAVKPSRCSSDDDTCTI